MAFTVNESTVPAEAAGAGVSRQPLLTAARVRDTKVLLDRVVLAAGALMDLSVAATSLAWFQVLDGNGTLDHGASSEALSGAHIVFLPPGFRGRLSSVSGASLLYAEIPHAERHDPEFARRPPALRIVDWTREPVLDSQHDARKRIYVVTPKLFGTRAVKGEMIIYPPGTVAANHHHEGAEHFMYVLAGRGTAFANESPIPVRAGDLIYYDDRERHYLMSEGSEEMRFVEFFVPGEYRTVWAPGASVCTWLPTGRDIRGGKPAREIAAHQSGTVAAPQDV